MIGKMVFTGAKVGLVAMEANKCQALLWVQVHQVRQLGAGSVFLPYSLPSWLGLLSFTSEGCCGFLP